jgi:muramoyltetrapeptide carboxypeptidase
MLLHPPRSLPKLIKPTQLRAGDTVMIIAPGSPPHSTNILEAAIKRLSDAGFNVHVGTYAREKHGFLAGIDSQRLSDLSQALASPTIKAIFCIRGGYGSGRLIHAVPFDVLKRHPKVFIGSSDLTGLLYGCALDGHSVCFHGPTLQSLVDPSCPDYTWRSFINTITGHHDAVGSILDGDQPTTPIEALKSGVATGHLIGGNLSILLSILGTKFFPSFDDSILFLEDVSEAPFRIDRYLTQLINLGAFERVRGFALGRFEHCEYRGQEAKSKQTLRDVIIDRLVPLGKPIVLGLPFGHTSYNATIPIGIQATLDANQGDLLIGDSGVARAKNAR